MLAAENSAMAAGPPQLVQGPIDHGDPCIAKDVFVGLGSLVLLSFLASHQSSVCISLSQCLL